MWIGPLLVPRGLWQRNAKPELVSSAGDFINTVLIQSYLDSGPVRGQLRLTSVCTCLFRCAHSLFLWDGFSISLILLEAIFCTCFMSSLFSCIICNEINWRTRDGSTLSSFPCVGTAHGHWFSAIILISLVDVWKSRTNTYAAWQLNTWAMNVSRQGHAGCTLHALCYLISAVQYSLDLAETQRTNEKFT